MDEPPAPTEAANPSAGMDIDAITPVAQDYVKAIWSATEWGGPPITGRALAARFGTTTANVTETIKRLDGQGLVVHERYKPIRLTAIGIRLAVAMVRRHRLIETFLVRTLGYRWDEVHDEAERLEHAATDDFIDRIDTQLGHPRTDPHGDPIPTPTGDVQVPYRDATPLSDATTGRYVIRRISDSDPDNLTTADRLGLRPGAIIDLDALQVGSAIRTGIGREELPLDLAAATWVTPAD